MCVEVCPKGCIVISKKSNKSGYFPAEVNNDECTGCAACAIICPDVVIKVYREKTIAAGPGKKAKPSLIREKRE